MILTDSINEEPPSVNDLYRRTPWGVRKSDKGKAFENRCTAVVAGLLRQRAFRPLPEHAAWELVVTLWLPKLETDQWRQHRTGGRFVRRDVDNPTKIVVDGIFRGIATDDSHSVSVKIEKRNGHGKSWIDFVLREVHVPSEELNATELVTKINKNKLVRASVMDPLQLLRNMAERSPASNEWRITPYDAWRTELMCQILSVLDQLQGRLDCPAKTGSLRACCGCSDMKVIHCLMSNPRTVDPDGTESGMFDLSEPRTGFHVAPVDPQGGDMENQKKPHQMFIEILAQLHALPDNPGSLDDIVKKMIFPLLQKLESERDDVTAQDYCVKTAMLMRHLRGTGFAKLPNSVHYYKSQVNLANPEELAEDLAAAQDPFTLAILEWKEFRAAYKELANKPAEPMSALTPPDDDAEEATEPEEKPEEEEPKPSRRKSRQRVSVAVEEETEEAASTASSVPGIVPPVTKNVSVSVPTSGSPQVSTIGEEDGEDAEETPVEKEEPEKAPQPTAGLSGPYAETDEIAKRLAAVEEKLEKLVNAVKQIVPAFNILNKGVADLLKK